MSLNDETKFQALAAHYKDTFELIKDDVARRDRYFIFILILLAVIIFQIFSPDIAEEIITATIKKQLDLNLALDTSSIDTMIWFGMLGLAHTYFQTVLHVQRQYNYIYLLEEQLNKPFKDFSFTREGKTFEKRRYGFSKWTKFVFWILFPTFFLVVIVGKMYAELTAATPLPINIYANIIITISLLTSTIHYLRALHLKK